MRLTKTCDKPVGIRFDAHRPQRRNSSVTPLFDACGSNEATIGRATSSRSTSRKVELKLPGLAHVPVRATGRRAPSAGRPARAPAARRDRALPRSGASSTVSNISLIEESGVRNSCETFERNSLRARSSRDEGRLIVGEDDDAARFLVLFGQRINRNAIGPRDPGSVSINGATEPSPCSASAIRRSSSTLGIASMM